MSEEAKTPEKEGEGAAPDFKGFDPSKMPPFDPEKMKDFDFSKLPPFDPEMMKNFDPSKMPPFDPEMMKDFDPSKLPPMGGFPMPDDSDDEELPDLLSQEDPDKWRRQPPRKMRGDVFRAMKCGKNAAKMKCNCWNKHCPFFGNCRRCITFHKALKQFPTCMRDQMIEMYKDGSLAYELYITDEEKPPEL